MTDTKLKIRIQLSPAENQDLHTPVETGEESGKAPFDWRKITLALFLTSCVLGLIVYAAITLHDNKSALSETSVNITSNESTSPPPNRHVKNEPTQEPINTSADLSLSTGGILPDTLPTVSIEIVTESDAHQDPEQYPTTTKKLYATADKTTKTTPGTLVDTTISTDQPEVARAQLTSAIERRDPVDAINFVNLNQGATDLIYFFIQLRGLSGQEVYVHWYYQNKEVAKVPLGIDTNHWRTYASKLLSKNKLGAWHVILFDQTGKKLARRNFTVSNDH